MIPHGRAVDARPILGRGGAILIAHPEFIDGFCQASYASSTSVCKRRQREAAIRQDRVQLNGLVFGNGSRTFQVTSVMSSSIRGGCEVAEMLHPDAESGRKLPSGRRVQRGRSPLWWGFGGTPPQPQSAPFPAREAGGPPERDGRTAVRPYEYGTGTASLIRTEACSIVTLIYPVPMRHRDIPSLTMSEGGRAVRTGYSSVDAACCWRRCILTRRISS